MKKILFALGLGLTMGTGAMAQKGTVAEYMEQGVALHDKGEYKAAIEKYGMALQLDNSSSSIHYEMASTYLALKNYTEALKHVDIVIKAGTQFLDQAYILKGNVLDMQGKSKEAISLYEKAIKAYPNNYLLYYNLALALFNNKNGDQAKIIDALQKALQHNPDHASSHALLGYTMIDAGKKVQALLALYNFMLLEPGSGRSEGVLTVLLEQMQSDVTRKDAKTINISFAADDNDEFRAADLALSMLEASKTLDENKDKPELEMFIKNTKAFFDIAGGMKKDHKGFWWAFYVDFFDALNKAGHTETLCYYIWQTKGSVKADQWLKNNAQRVDKFSEWYESYKRQF